MMPAALLLHTDVEAVRAPDLQRLMSACRPGVKDSPTIRLPLSPVTRGGAGGQNNGQSDVHDAGNVIVPSRRTRLRGKSSGGFTLVELILVIVILGVLGALGAGILLQPFKAFQDQSRRAALVAEADLTLAYMARELRMALPNSVRVSGQYIEFIPTVDGGRYRVAESNDLDNPGDPLRFDQPDSSFDVIGGLSAWGEPGGPKAGDYVVVFNTHATDNTPTNAYRGDNRQAVSGYNTTTHTITLNAARQFPAGSSSHRFDIAPASGPVTYYCHGGRLYRHSDYGFQFTQATNFTTQGAVLADNVSLCEFAYQPGTGTRSGVASLRLAMTRDGETISLLYQVQIINAP